LDGFVIVIWWLVRRTILQTAACQRTWKRRGN
jgi:hypothetical protein